MIKIKKKKLTRVRPTLSLCVSILQNLSNTPSKMYLPKEDMGSGECGETGNKTGRLYLM